MQATAVPFGSKDVQAVSLDMVYSAMQQLELIRVLFAAIAELAKDRDVVAHLAVQGEYIADVIHNDVDVVREGLEMKDR